MGGDHGPETTIKALDLASKVHPNILFRLFGDKDKAVQELDKYKDFTKYDILIFETSKICKHIVLLQLS